MKLSDRLLRERAFVESSLGNAEICTCCHATLETYATACVAGLSEYCHGSLAIESARDKFCRVTGKEPNEALDIRHRPEHHSAVSSGLRKSSAQLRNPFNAWRRTPEDTN